MGPLIQRVDNSRPHKTLVLILTAFMDRIVCLITAFSSTLLRDVAQAQAVVKDTNTGLRRFQLTPEGVIGQDFLEHMFLKHQMCYKTKATDLYAPNAYLDVAMLPGNLEILQFKTAPDLTRRSIVGDCADNGATMNLAARKLNNTGDIQHHCGLENTEEKVRKLQNQLQLSDSIVAIIKEHDNEASQKRIKVQSMHSEVVPVAIQRLKANNGDATKLTKKEILAILFFVFHTLEEDKKKKDVRVAVLSHHTRKD
jgi:hypothetical protein